MNTLQQQINDTSRVQQANNQIPDNAASIVAGSSTNGVEHNANNILTKSFPSSYVFFPSDARQGQVQVPTTDDDEIDFNIIARNSNHFVDNTGQQQWQCHFCLKSFTTKHNLVLHILGHVGVTHHMCFVCRRMFKQLGNLNAHVLSHHNVAEHANCLQAPHQKNPMPVNDVYQHNNGGNNSNYEGGKLQHQQGGQELPQKNQRSVSKGRQQNNYQANNNNGRRQTHVSCDVCERLFKYPSQLRDHMLIHTQDRRYVCQVCGMKFMKEHHLKAHHITHSSMKPYSCPVCGRRFSLKANMERHVYIHNAERQFACEKCGKKFSQPQTLKMHMVSHADVKPYSCNICGKGISRAHNLRAHMAIHQNNKPHKCQACNSTFTLKGNMHRHQKEKHGGIIEGPAQSPRDMNEDSLNKTGHSPGSIVEPEIEIHQRSNEEVMTKSTNAGNINVTAKKRKNTPKRVKNASLQQNPSLPSGANMSTTHMKQQYQDGQSENVLPVPSTSCGGSQANPHSRPQDTLTVASPYFHPPAGHPETPLDHKHFSSYMHSLHPTAAGPLGMLPHSSLGATPVGGILGGISTQGYYSNGDHQLNAGHHANNMSVPEVGVKLQALHAAIDDLAVHHGSLWSKYRTASVQQQPLPPPPPPPPPPQEQREQQQQQHEQPAQPPPPPPPQQQNSADNCK